MAAYWAGWQNVFNCEVNEFCRRVLKFHFPDALQYGNIKETDFTEWRGRVDILSGGFPCQPFSVAGRRRGESDDRYLWPEMLRAVKQISPRWVVAENVPGLLSMSGGMVFARVCSDLEDAGYQVQPVIIPACSIGAPHKRSRIWIIAHSDAIRPRGGEGQQESVSRSNGAPDTRARRTSGVAAYTYGERRPGELLAAGASQAKERYCVACTKGMYDFTEFPTESPICCDDDGISAGLDGITIPKWRSQSIAAFGNAIVPHVFYQIAMAINEYENTVFAAQKGVV